MSFELSRLASGGFATDESSRAADRPRREGRHRHAAGSRHFPPPPAPPSAERWESLPLTSEQKRRNPNVIPETLLPRALLRFGDAEELLVSGLLDHGGELARRAAVVEAPLGKGQHPALRDQPDLARLDDRQPPAGVERDSRLRPARARAALNSVRAPSPTTARCRRLRSRRRTGWSGTKSTAMPRDRQLIQSS